MRTFKPKSFYKKELKNIIKLVSKKHPEVLKRKIDVDRFCSDKQYRNNLKWNLLHIEQRNEIAREQRRNNPEYFRERNRERQRNNPERQRENLRRYREAHPELTRERNRLAFQRRTINNPRKAMLTAATSRMASAVISRLWIRPTICPHCGKASPHIDFHHPNHLFWWKWTFCCKSCHYFFNRDKVPASDKIIDLKKLLRESNSH